MSKCYFGVVEENPALGIAAVSTNDDEMVNQVGLSRKHIFDAVENSVKRLGTYIDVLQIHRLDRSTPREEIMKALNDVVEKGWVRYIGASSVSTHATQYRTVPITVSEARLTIHRWRRGNSRLCRTLRTGTDGTNSSPCRTTTT